MKKYISISAITVGLLSSVNVNAADDLSSMFSEGKVSGQVRMFSIDRKYQGSKGNTTHRNATAIGGNLKFETADFHGLFLGAGAYSTNRVASSPTRDGTLFGNNDDGYTILGEAYVGYKRGNTVFKGGRQKLNTPLAGTDDARMLPNLFEAYVVSNTDIPYTTLTAAHVTKFAQGTFGRTYSNSSKANQLLSVTSGYSYSDPQGQVGDFENMGSYALGNTAKNDGVSVGSIIFSPNKYIKAQVWDYYAYDILNAVYGQVDLKWNCLISDAIHPFLSGQVISEDEVGKKYAGKVNGTYWGAKLGFKVAGLTLYGAYSETNKNNAAEKTAGGLAHAIITPWGGMPAYTQGMVTRHQFLAGTKASKVAASYNFKDLGANVTTTAYYTSFDMDSNSGYGIKRTATEPGFDIIYNDAIINNLQLRFRGNFPRKFHEDANGDTGWDEYRLIANYNF